jgi:hypothetical protein
VKPPAILVLSGKDWEKDQELIAALRQQSQEQAEEKGKESMAQGTARPTGAMSATILWIVNAGHAVNIPLPA